MRESPGVVRCTGAARVRAWGDLLTLARARVARRARALLRARSAWGVAARGRVRLPPCAGRLASRPACRHVHVGRAPDRAAPLHRNIRVLGLPNRAAPTRDGFLLDLVLAPAPNHLLGLPAPAHSLVAVLHGAAYLRAGLLGRGHGTTARDNARLLRGLGSATTRGAALARLCPDTRATSAALRRGRGLAAPACLARRGRAAGRTAG